MKHRHTFDGIGGTVCLTCNRKAPARRQRVHKLDFTIHNFGSILTLNPETDAARAWVDENIGRDNGYQPWYPDAIIVEPRYVAEIVEGLSAEGLSYA